MAERATYTSVMKNRGFLNLWINQVLVQLSYNALNFSLIIWVFKLTNSNTAVSALLFAVYLPAVILGLFSGVLVDLIDRKKIIMAINILLAICFVSLIFFKGSFPAILIIAFLVNALGQFYAPAEASAIPLIVKKQELIAANSLFSATLYTSFLLGFGLSGPLLSNFGIDFVFALGALLLTIGFFLSLVFPSIVAPADEQGRKLIRALKKGDYRVVKEVGFGETLRTMRLIRGKLPVLTSITILAGVQMVIGILAVLTPGFLEKSLQIKATDASYVLIAPLGIWIVVGGIILGKVGEKLIKRRLVSRAILFGGILFFLVGVAPLISPAISYFRQPKPVPFFYQPPLSTILIAGSFLLGLAMVSILVPTQTVLQENTPDGARGKVYSVLGVAMSALSLIPVLISGVLADIFGTTPIFIGLGAIIILAGLFGLKPNLFFTKHQMPFKAREFFGVGHWEK